MRFVLHAMLLAFTAFLVQPGTATEPSAKQIRLTEKQIQGFISAQKEMASMAEKMPDDDKPDDPKIRAELEAIAKKQGFANFDEYDIVAANIWMVIAGIDAATKKFTDPRVALEAEIASITADPTIPAADKKQVLDELNQALKATQPIQYSSNIDLVLKYYDKIEAAIEATLSD
jgi:hypothetical protein